jgi:hypothetical protein
MMHIADARALRFDELNRQWQDELKDKFDLTFDIVSREQIETSVTGNPFVERSWLIIRAEVQVA